MKKIELTEAQVLERLRGLVTRERKQCVIAAELGVSDTYVCNVLAGRRKPSPEFLALIGVTKRTVYEGVKK